MVNYVRKIEGNVINSIESLNGINFIGILNIGRYIDINKFIGFFQKLYNSYKISNLETPIEKGLKNNKDYIKIKIDFNA